MSRSSKYLEPNGWRWVPLSWIQEHLVYSCDFGAPDGYGTNYDFWKMFIESKALDVGFIDVLESLQTHGWMAPLHVELENYGMGDEITLNDGHHRLAAAILLCMDEVPIWNWEWEGKRRLDDCPQIYTEYDLPGDGSLLLEA